ncbi:MAG: hypothetical protein MUF81_01620 [Verrucomicrobia bacterium]|jgi:hypothetical protein|nr:hypothetical protein [Verrucomicrobiota bacterium]
MKVPITFFAPAERESLEVVHRQAGSFSRAPVARTLLNATLNYLFVLNSRRQIVMASENVLELVPDKTMDQIIGLRPGEALGCIHAGECESGCGTSRFCSRCGAVHVILSGLKGCRAMEECHLTRSRNGKAETLHLQVLATPLVHNQERYTLLTVANVSNPER